MYLFVCVALVCPCFAYSRVFWPVFRRRLYRVRHVRWRRRRDRTHRAGFYGLREQGERGALPPCRFLLLHASKDLGIPTFFCFSTAIPPIYLPWRRSGSIDRPHKRVVIHMHKIVVIFSVQWHTALGMVPAALQVAPDPPPCRSVTELSLHHVVGCPWPREPSRGRRRCLLSGMFGGRGGSGKGQR